MVENFAKSHHMLHSRLIELFQQCQNKYLTTTTCQKGSEEERQWCSATMYGSFCREGNTWCRDGKLDAFKPCHSLRSLTSGLMQLDIKCSRQQSHRLCRINLGFREAVAAFVHSYHEYIDFADAHFIGD